MSGPPNKKRALMPSSAAVDSSLRSVGTVTPHAHSANATASSFLNTSIDSSILKAEVEHERFLRALDAKRAQNERERLENLVKFATSELEVLKSMLEEEQSQGAVRLEQMRMSRDEAVQKLRELQLCDPSKMDGADDAALWKRKNSLLQSQNEALDEEVNQMRLQLKQLRTELEQSLEEKSFMEPTTPIAAASVDGQISPAPSGLLQELHRLRITLAETERRERQSRLAAEEWQLKFNTLLPEREAARSLQIRVRSLESQLHKLQKLYQMAHLKDEEWQKFGQILSEYFPGDQKGTSKADYSTPPEVKTILRKVHETKQELLEARKENQKLLENAEKLMGMNRPTEARLKAYEEKETSWQAERKLLENQLNSTTRLNETLQRQERIWKREIASLKEVVQTFDKLPLAKSAGSVHSVDSKSKIVELELVSMKEELDLLKGSAAKAHEESSKRALECQEQQKELDRIKEKYGKLKEALQVQKGKAQEADARAILAEEIAGKGSFDPAFTRVLHLSRNPLTQFLKQQNTDLKKRLQDMQSKGGDLAATTQTEVNPDKLHQRLKQSFKEQIARFREGVYLMTGYKIDMIPGNDQPTFRVRSMYAAREEDHLILMWPKLPQGELPSSLDLVATDWANTLAHADSYQYISRYKSLPAFLASVQLSQFENQTLM